MPTPKAQQQQSVPATQVEPQHLMYDGHGYAVAVGSSAVEIRQLRDLNPVTNPNAIVDLFWQGTSILWNRPFRTIGGGILIAGALISVWNVGAGMLLAATGAVRPVALGQVRDKSSISQVSFAIGSSFAAPVAKTGTLMVVDMAKGSAPQGVLVDDREADLRRPDDFQSSLGRVQGTRSVRYDDRGGN